MRRYSLFYELPVIEEDFIRKLDVHRDTRRRNRTTRGFRYVEIGYATYNLSVWVNLVLI
jgi:hypothetical protein